MTRFTQACDRSPGQRNTTTSPRFGTPPNTRPVPAGYLNRQRGRAVPIGTFRRQQRVADQKCRLHRARRHIERFGERALGEGHRQHDRGELQSCPRQPCVFGAAASCLWSLARSSNRNALHPQRRLADADRHALAVLAAGADAGVEREIVADHGDPVQIGRPVADQDRALQRRADLAVLDFVGLGALEYVFA